MYTLITVLIIIASIVMVLIVLVQNSKGGGLSSSFGGGGGGGQMGGVVQTNKFLEKTTWVLAVALLVLSITASLSIPRPDADKESATKKHQRELNTTNVPGIMTPEQVDKLNKEEEKKDK